MNDLSQNRTYSNIFYGEETRPVSNIITGITAHKIGHQGKCKDWTHCYPIIVAITEEGATFFAGQVWDYESFLAGKSHNGIVFNAARHGDNYYAEKVLADLKGNSV